MKTDIDFLSLRSSFEYPPIDRDVLSEFSEWEDRGRLGFMDLPFDRGLISGSMELSEKIRGEADSMVVVGIGGSSLGLRALLNAFPSHAGRVHVVDSPDSRELSRLMGNLDPDRTCLAVVTKSGGTAETMAMFLSMYEWIESGSGSSRIVAVTDPERGDLRRLCTQRGWPSLPVPPSVGGRYSVLSPVGMFPAAFAGLDVISLLRGAGLVVEDFRRNGAESLVSNVAACMLNNFRSHSVHVFFTYDDRLMGTGLWYAQLWAESLGKKTGLNGEELNAGQTPLACRGPADQHSLVQLFMEGPKDKAVTIVTAPAPPDAPPLPGGFEEYDSLSYLQGLTVDRLRAAEADATGVALEERGLPVNYISLGRMDETSLGGLLMTMMMATVICGLSLGIDPLDQPGVERGKILTYRALGRPGYGDR